MFGEGREICETEFGVDVQSELRKLYRYFRRQSCLLNAIEEGEILFCFRLGLRTVIHVFTEMRQKR